VRASYSTISCAAGSLSYVNFNPTLTGNTPSKSGSGGEAHGVVACHGSPPRGRKAARPTYLQQSHADASLGLAYVVGPHTELEAGYHFTYFFQH
jgi:hypothetical protein